MSHTQTTIHTRTCQRITQLRYCKFHRQELNEHNQPISQENTFRAACEYKIIADKAAANHCPYPMTCHDSNWGPSWSLISHYQLSPQQEDGVISISSPTGKPVVQTEIVFDKHRDDVSLLCKLRKNGVTDEDILDEYIEIVEKSDKTSFVIKLPEPGLFKCLFIVCIWWHCNGCIIICCSVNNSLLHNDKIEAITNQ